MAPLPMVSDRIPGLLAMVPLSLAADRTLGPESENDSVPWLQYNKQKV